MSRYTIALLALTTTAIDLEAGPFRRRARSSYHYYPSQQQQIVTPTEFTSYYSPASLTTYDTTVIPASDSIVVPAADPIVMPTSDSIVMPAANSNSMWSAVGDGLDEVNAQRAARGLRPYIRDEGLTQAAQACAAFRAERGLFAHTSNDFAFVPPGSYATAAGCAAYTASHGWMSCCVYDNYTYGGAAWVTGRDGKRYMHLFVR